MASQTEGKPEWFLPGVTDQMLSEIIVGKSWKLASPQYALKSESDEIVMPWFTMHNCLCLKPNSIVLRATPWWSSTITTSRCRNCTWQSKGWHSLYFIYNLLILTKNLRESCEQFWPSNLSLFYVLKCLLWKVMDINKTNKRESKDYSIKCSVSMCCINFSSSLKLLTQ